MANIATTAPDGLDDYQNVIASMRSEFESGVFAKEKD